MGNGEQACCCGQSGNEWQGPSAGHRPDRRPQGAWKRPMPGAHTFSISAAERRNLRALLAFPLALGGGSLSVVGCGKRRPRGRAAAHPTHFRWHRLLNAKPTQANRGQLDSAPALTDYGAVQM